MSSSKVTRTHTKHTDYDNGYNMYSVPYLVFLIWMPQVASVILIWPLFGLSSYRTGIMPFLSRDFYSQMGAKLLLICLYTDIFIWVLVKFHGYANPGHFCMMSPGNNVRWGYSHSKAVRTSP